MADSAGFWAASGRTAREVHEALYALRRRNEDSDSLPEGYGQGIAACPFTEAELGARSAILFLQGHLSVESARGYTG